MLLMVLLATASAEAQTIPAVGSLATLDVATWNIEEFGDLNGGPSDDERQFGNVLAVMRQAEIDLWALQEMKSQLTFNRLLDSLGTGFGGFWTDDDTNFDIGYGFIYRTEAVTQLQAGTVLDGSSFAFGSRPPLQLRARVTLPDTTIDEVRFLNVHMKAGGGLDDYNRRVDASEALKNYVDNLQAIGVPVVILGDLNDELLLSIASGRTSPYQNFLDDDSPDGSGGYYLFVTRDFDQPGSSGDINTFCGSSSACSSGSVLDHIIATGDLANDYVSDSAQRYSALLDAITVYTSSTSDHLPVYAQFQWAEATATEPAVASQTFRIDALYPNPFAARATLRYSTDRPAPVRVELFDVLGRRVALSEEGTRSPGRYSIQVNGQKLAPGLYVVRLTAGDQSITQRLVRSTR